MNTLIKEIGKIIAIALVISLAYALIMMAAGWNPANADDAVSDPAVSDSGGSDDGVVDDGMGAAAVSCGGPIVDYSDAYKNVYERTFRLAGRVQFQICRHATQPNLSYLRLTHLGAWYYKTAGATPACDPFGSAAIDKFGINIDSIDGYDPPTIYLDCTDGKNWNWWDIPNRAIYAGDDRCFKVSSAKAIITNDPDLTYTGFTAACLPTP